MDIMQISVTFFSTSEPNYTNSKTDTSLAGPQAVRQSRPASAGWFHILDSALSSLLGWTLNTEH